MAVYGIVADIHGNREALEAALEALASRDVERLLCLGDLIGYNADPDECVAMLRARGALAIAGNHDLIALGQLDFRRCSSKAAYALKRTRRSLAPETRAYLAALPPHRVLESSIVLVHGGVRDVQQYMVSPSLIRDNAALLGEDFPGARLCFFGHSHEQKVYRVDGQGVEELAFRSQQALSSEALYFINPGSVDASRKRGHRVAECAILDTGAQTIEFLRVAYDAAACEAKAAAFGYRIPPWLERVDALRRRYVSYRLRLLTTIGWRRASAR
jgi:predicted phosphodiesterase